MLLDSQVTRPCFELLSHETKLNAHKRVRIGLKKLKNANYGLKNRNQPISMDCGCSSLSSFGLQYAEGLLSRGI